MKSLFEQTGGIYRKESDYLIPNLVLPAEKDEQVVGIWGQRHLRYIKQYRRVYYTNMLTSGNLNRYLVELNSQAEDLFFRLVNQMAEKQGLTENLKARNQLEWVGRMNNIQAYAMEIVESEIIYAQ